MTEVIDLCSPSTTIDLDTSSQMQTAIQIGQLQEQIQNMTVELRKLKQASVRTPPLPLPIQAVAAAPLVSPIVTKRVGVLGWDDYFMSVTFLSAMRSKDPSTQVLVVITFKNSCPSPYPPTPHLRLQRL